MIALLRLIPAPYLAVGLLIAAGALYSAGYIKGVSVGRVEAMKDTVAAYGKREGINHEVSGMDAVAVCIELGGLRDECEQLRGLAANPAEAR
ncbi:MAG: hypothetical protein R3D70_09260 [Rhizobiaceae bacterium]